MDHFNRLELFCRLFLGLFVGFFCVTAALFVRYKTANHLPQVTAVQSKGASQALAANAPAKTFASASQVRPATPSLDPEERILITSSTSTIVTFIAAMVANLLSWRKGKRRQPPKARGAPPASHST
ncbi:MAG TPA: hypothetical protein VJS30_21605 [Paraburkholderia sp.]|nr:hypothetical protein [Paraburkholderia sp.]